MTTQKSKPAKPATGKATASDKIVVAFHAREGTNRAKLLARLARDLGKPVAVAELMKAVYGVDDDERGKLVRVLAGVTWMIGKYKPGYKLTKDGEGSAATFTLSASR